MNEYDVNQQSFISDKTYFLVREKSKILPRSSTSHGLGLTKDKASSNFKPPSRFSISKATSYTKINRKLIIKKEF